MEKYFELRFYIKIIELIIGTIGILGFVIYNIFKK